MQGNKKTVEWDLFEKIGDNKGTSHARMHTIKDRRDLTEGPNRSRRD